MTSNRIYSLLVELEGMLAMMSPKELAEALRYKKIKEEKEYEEALLKLLKLLS